MNRSIALAIASGIALQGCILAGRIGTPFDTSHMRDIRQGIDDKAKMVAWFGEPYETETLALGGTCVDRYRYQYAQPGQSKVLFVDFDRNGAVCSTTYACKGTCAGTDAAPETWAYRHSF